jgi:hypothetical protein
MLRRRTALGLLAGLAGATSLPVAARTGKPVAAAAFDPANPEHAGLAFRKLAWSMDEALTFHWLHGTRYGVQGSLLTGFWEMHVGTWFRARDLPDGRYEVRSAGANFYSLPGEKQLLEHFRNPYTGETVDIPYAPPRLTVAVYDRHGGAPIADAPGAPAPRKADAWVDGGEVRVRGDLTMHTEPVGPGKRSFTVQDMSTWIGSVTDVMNPEVRNPPAQHMFNDVLDFPPYLKMGNEPGTYFSRCYGHKVYRYEDMPAVWRTLFEGRFPDVAKNPGTILDTRI